MSISIPLFQKAGQGDEKRKRVAVSKSAHKNSQSNENETCV